MPTHPHSRVNRCSGIEPKFNRHGKQTRELFPPNRSTEVATSAFRRHPVSGQDWTTFNCVSKQITYCPRFDSSLWDTPSPFRHSAYRQVELDLWTCFVESQRNYSIQVIGRLSTEANKDLRVAVRGARVRRHSPSTDKSVLALWQHSIRKKSQFFPSHGVPQGKHFAADIMSDRREFPRTDNYRQYRSKHTGTGRAAGTAHSVEEILPLSSEGLFTFDHDNQCTVIRIVLQQFIEIPELTGADDRS